MKNEITNRIFRNSLKTKNTRLIPFDTWMSMLCQNNSLILMDSIMTFLTPWYEINVNSKHFLGYIMYSFNFIPNGFCYCIIVVDSAIYLLYPFMYFICWFCDPSYLSFIFHIVIWRINVLECISKSFLELGLKMCYLTFILLFIFQRNRQPIFFAFNIYGNNFLFIQ